MDRRGSDQKGAQMPTFYVDLALKMGTLAAFELIPTGNLEI
jgi:hypothetical protein